MIFVTFTARPQAGQTAGMFMGIGRGRAAKKVAAEHGLELDTKKYTAPTSYALLSMGTSRRTLRKMANPAGGASVFDFDCNVTVHNGAEEQDDVKVKRFTCALIDVPFVAPHTLLRRESRGSRFVAWVGGPADMQIGVDEFDKRHKLQTVDEDFARTLLDPSVVGWALHADEVGKSMMFEFLGNKLLCMSKQCPVADFPAMLDWAVDFVRLAPPALAERYPRTKP